MADEYTAWLDEYLGAQVRYQLQLEPKVAADYLSAFQRDPVALQWMAAQGTELPESESIVTAPEKASDVSDQMDPILTEVQSDGVSNEEIREIIRVEHPLDENLVELEEAAIEVNEQILSEAVSQMSDSEWRELTLEDIDDVLDRFSKEFFADTHTSGTESQ